ncbi:hypothetical protein IF1G_05819 [Cordyceps javanica]|uniref:Uncharacterized protein n=1 Tax=Cordyceps javanica TaxID=43265 RepID=A0A545V2P6_9HYPO|nr:hypothetical protein IF1G_05819 [Cordyceps javanica]
MYILVPSCGTQAVKLPQRMPRRPSSIFLARYRHRNVQNELSRVFNATSIHPSTVNMNMGPNLASFFYPARLYYRASSSSLASRVASIASIASIIP